MSQILTLADQVYQRLSTEARRRGFKNIEEFLELWALPELDLDHRQATVHHIRALRERFTQKYGPAPDSTDLLRMDRMR